MVWAWMHWPMDHGLGMDALASGWVGSKDVIMVWACMQRPVDALVAWTYHGLGMDALANGCFGSMDVIMVWAWMPWPVDGLVAWA